MFKKILLPALLLFATSTVNAQETIQHTLIPNGGFTVQSLWRGVLGMVVLLALAYLFSSNRRSIKWRTVGIGIGLQLVIAIGVLKIPVIQAIFEFVGKVTTG